MLHTIIFAQLLMNGTSQGVHAFIAQIRDADGNICPNVHIADCGHKIGLNGVDNGWIWFDNIRVPRENLLNTVAFVSEDGRSISSIKDPDQRFATFLAPLTFGRVNIASTAVYISKVGLAIAVRYGLTRRAFSISPNVPEVLSNQYFVEAEGASRHRVILIAATNSSEGLQPPIRRCFSHEVSMTSLSEEQRSRMISETLRGFSKVADELLIVLKVCNHVFVTASVMRLARLL